MHSKTQDKKVVRARALLAVAIGVMAVAVWGTAHLQRRAAVDAIELERASERMMIAMLDQQSALRGYALTRQESFLDPYRSGTSEFEQALAAAERLANRDLRTRIDAQVAAARAWQELAERHLRVLRSSRPDAAPAGGDVRRKDVFDRFRAANAALQDEVGRDIDRQLGLAATLALRTVLGLSLLFGAINYFVIERQALRNRRHEKHELRARQAQAEFTETMQVMRDEGEAYRLVKRYLERSIDGTRVTVLNRNNSDNRVTAATSLAGDDGLREALKSAVPESCLAIRLGRTFERHGNDEPLLSCELCAAALAVVCVPSLVSGDVIGAVQVRHDESLERETIERMVTTVAQSAPVLANLRSLAIAETRAATDALTGLPNARACHDNLKRMIAHAGRTLSPLSAVMLDLDHFKQVNDQFGHGAGDDVLAATGVTLASAMRDSDFVGRSGGEEFLLLLPDTDREGARVVAEKVRRFIEQITVPQVDRVISASLGVAAYPLDAIDGDSLVRQADQALYAAKAAGRNRVEVAGGVAPAQSGDSTHADSR